MQYQYAPLRGVYNPEPNEFFPKTSLEGQTTWSKMVKIEQNHCGGAMTGVQSFDSNQIIISINTDCVSEL